MRYLLALAFTWLALTGVGCVHSRMLFNPTCGPGGDCNGAAGLAHAANKLPPAERLMHPGPGVAGPGPGVIPPMPPMRPPGPPPTSQVAFIGPAGMQVQWDAIQPGMFDSQPLIVPGRFNFGQGAIYRLKLTNIPNRPGLELYPSLEVAPVLPRTAAYLSHNSIPIQFTPEDFDQVQTGHFVTKVIYLPDPEFQELAIAGVETLVSTRLDPGVDPIVEADRRGAILAIVRLGNKDFQLPGPDGQMVGGAGMMGPMGPGGMPMAAVPPGAVGAPGPQWGLPRTGTPIGLPGPPHLPLGAPAGLQQHTMRNYTPHHIPLPVDHMKYNIKESPGYSYPKPVDRVHVHEFGK
ncbi:Hypothetical protein PBC10988_12770 [Planctomycetales bacterium 10988]|nr:Hypothetical protein PBC10988_12770 [Planctomycetales bacterium 10988]